MLQKTGRRLSTPRARCSDTTRGGDEEESDAATRGSENGNDATGGSEGEKGATSGDEEEEDTTSNRDKTQDRCWVCGIRASSTILPVDSCTTRTSLPDTGMRSGGT